MKWTSHAWLCAFSATIALPVKLWVDAIEASPNLFSGIQPDGTPTGLQRLEGSPEQGTVVTLTADGYTTVKDDKGWLHFAVEDPFDGELKPSGMKVGKDRPDGIPKRIKLKREKIREKCRRSEICQNKDDERRRLMDETDEDRKRRHLLATGTLKNLVLLVRFSDHSKRVLPSRQDIDVLMNKVGGDPNLAPTGSVRDVFTQSSYGKLTLQSTVTDWVTLDAKYTEAYCADNAYGMSAKIKECLHHALTKLKAREGSNLNFRAFDVKENAGTGDGLIDAIAVLHSGYGSENGGTDCSNPAATEKARIWSHMWGNINFSTDGVTVLSYHISPALWGTCASTIGRIGVIAHETGHFLGLPDLYDGLVGNGVGSYCLMANSWGFDGQQRYPPMMGAWSRQFLGWSVPEVISTNGAYSLTPAARSDEVYRIDDGYPAGEYLLIENRQPFGFDQVPRGGLVIWHIDEKASYVNEGFPSQAGWPTNGNHYRVALLQADGLYNLENGVNRGDAGDVWTQGTLGPSINTNTGPFPNTDAYQGGNVYKTQNTITNINQSGGTFNFKYWRMADTTCGARRSFCTKNTDCCSNSCMGTTRTNMICV